MSVPRKPPSVSPPVQVQTQQPRGPQVHFTSRGQTPPIPFRQLSQEEFQRNQVFQQQQFSGYAAGNTHEHMNKQQMPTHVPVPGQNQGQPGLQQQVMYQAAQHQGGQPRPGTPGSNAALGGGGYAPGGGGAMYHNPGAGQLGPASMEDGVSFTIPRQNVPQSIRAGQQRQPLTLPASAGQALYNNPQVHTTMYVQGQPPPPYIHGQPQVIIQQGPPPPLQVPPQYQQSARGMQTSFTITTSQPNYMAQPPHANFYPQGGNGAYFMQTTPAIVPQQAQRPMEQPAQPYQKRQKKIIRITDPNTGRDISDEIMSSGIKTNTPPQSGPNSSRATPVSGPPPTGASPRATPPPAVLTKENQVDIAAQFAAQVAATLSQKSMQQRQQSPQQQLPTAQQLQQLPQQVQQQQQIPQQLAQQQQQQITQQAQVADQARQPTPVEEKPASSPADSEAESLSKEPSVSRESSEPREVTPEEKPASPAVTPVEPVVTPQVAVPVTITPPTPEATANKDGKKQKEDSPAPTEKPEPEAAPVEKVEKEVEEVREKEVEVEKEKTRPASEPREVSEPKKEEVQEVSEVKAAPKADKPAAKDDKDDGKDKKKSKKQKQKELNQKGENKEGSDMDAFNLPPASAPAATPAAAPQNQAPPPQPQETPQQTPPATQQQKQQPPTTTQPPAQQTQQQQQPEKQPSREQTPEVVKDVEPKKKTPEPEPAKSAPEPTPESTLNNKDKEEASMEKVEIKVVEDEKVAEKNEKNEDTRRRGSSQQPQEDSWRKPNNTASTETGSSWRKSPPGKVEDAWRKPAEKPAASPVSIEEPWRKPSAERTAPQQSVANDEPWRKPPTGERSAQPNVANDEPWRKPPQVPTSNNEESQKNSVDGGTKEEGENKDAKDSTTISNNKNSSSDGSNSNKTVITKDSSVELKYQYQEGQWSPANQTGKKSYDRNFLLQMQYSNESLEKPDGLPRLPDVILDKPLPRSDPSRGGMSHLKPGSDIDFTPGFVKPTSAKGGSQSMGRSRSQQKGGNPKDMPRKIISISRDLDTKLHTTENAWKPGYKSSKQGGQGGGGEDGDTAELLKNIRAILNKLTPQKFQTLLRQIMNLKLDTPEKLKGTINLVFEKAIDEPAFSSTYANLCRCMNSIKVPLEDNPSEYINFRKILLVRCQTEFEKDRSDEIDSENRQKVIDEKSKELKEKEPNKELEAEIKLLTEEKILAETKARRRSLGNIRFIGELFKLGILNEMIMHSCITKLLGAMDEDSLECLCRLLMTIGKTLDKDDKDNRAKIDMYFKKLTQLSVDKKISARIRFMIQDVMDLRRSKWIPRRDDNNPKTIDELHKEIQLEDQQKAQFLSNITLTMPKHGGPHHGDGGRGRRGRGPGGNVDDGGWQSVAKPLRNTQSIDPGRMKLTKQTFDDNIQLGPSSNFLGWGRGSSGGGGKSSRENKSNVSLTPNKYDALRHDSARRGDSYESGRSESTGRGSMSSRERDRERDRDRDRDSKGGWSQPRGKLVARASQEQDREAALSAVSKSVRGVSRSMMSGRGRSTTPTGSRTQSLEAGRRDGGQPRGEPEPAAAPPAEVLSDSEIKRKTTALMDEYLGINDTKEAMECVKELQTPTKMALMVSTALNHVIEKSPVARKSTGQLLAQLLKNRIITQEDYLKGLDDILEFAEDMAIDIPKIYQYLGELIGPVVDEGNVELTLLAKACNPLLDSGKAGVLMAEILNNSASRQGEAGVAKQWSASGLNWSSLIAKDNVKEFVERYKVGYTVSEGSGASSSSSGSSSAAAAASLSMKQIQDELDKLIGEKKAKDEEVFNWVMTHVGDRCREPAFIRALMTSVCTSAISGSSSSSMKAENAAIVARSAMLMKYLDHKPEHELQALYALQALVHRLDHPAGLLRSFFDVLYDEDIISEDAFNHWETSSDPAEQAGKGVALKSVVQFFTWLREADEESPEDN